MTEDPNNATKPIHPPYHIGQIIWEDQKHVLRFLAARFELNLAALKNPPVPADKGYPGDQTLIAASTMFPLLLRLPKRLTKDIAKAFPDCKASAKLAKVFDDELNGGDNPDGFRIERDYAIAALELQPNALASFERAARKESTVVIYPPIKSEAGTGKFVIDGDGDHKPFTAHGIRWELKWGGLRTDCHEAAEVRRNARERKGEGNFIACPPVYPPKTPSSKGV